MKVIKGIFMLSTSILIITMTVIFTIAAYKAYSDPIYYIDEN